MSWRDLLRALDEEAAREVDAVRATAARDAERMLEDAGREAEANRAAALERVAAEASTARRRAVTELQRDMAREVLAARREVLDDVRAGALERLRAADAASLTPLVDALAPEVGEGASIWIVDAGRLEELRDHLARAHPRLLERAELRAAATERGGIEVRAGRRVLDATAAARLERVWVDAEPQLARLLFEGGS